MANRSATGVARPDGATDLETGLDDTAIGALRMGVMRLSRRLRLESSTEELNVTQFNVLAMLAAVGPLTPGELATAERVKPPSMTRAVNALEEAGLVTRQPHATDGRQVVVDVTARAHDVLEAARDIRTAWLRDHLAGLTHDEQVTLAAAAPLLERLAHS